MNTKWFSGIGLAVLLSTGTLIYTTTQARPQPSEDGTAAHDAALENLTTCATEKNPAYVESVLKGAMNAFDKDAEAALNANNLAKFKTAAHNLITVIKFLFVQSKHFSPIYKNAAHKPTFDKDIDKLIQSLLHKQYALAKTLTAKKEVVKDYITLVAELTKDGVAGLTKITAPSGEAPVEDEAPEGEATEGEAPAEEAPEGEATEGEAPAEEAPEGEATEGEEEATEGEEEEAPAEDESVGDGSESDTEEEVPAKKAKKSSNRNFEGAASNAFSSLFN